MGFQIQSVIREHEGELLQDLLSRLETWNDLFDGLVLNDIEVADAHGNSKSTGHPEPQIEMDTVQSPVSIRTLAKKLHKTLYQQ